MIWAFITLALTTFAQTSSDSDLEKAYQREYAYLISQREALAQLKATIEKNMTQRLAKQKAVLVEVQKRVAKDTARNDELFEELAQLEKRKKELTRRGSSIENTVKRAQNSVLDFESALRFAAVDTKNITPTPESPRLEHLDPWVKRALLALDRSSRSETLNMAYLDRNDQLTEGAVTRLGRVAAFIDNGHERVLLGPSGAGPLKSLASARTGEWFLIKNLSEAAQIQHTAGWAERLADISPVFFLALMLLLVTGLFLALVRV